MEAAKKLRQRISQGHFAMGTFVVELRTPAVVRFLAQSEFDFMLVDNEHGYWNPLDIAQQIDAAKRWEFARSFAFRQPIAEKLCGHSMLERKASWCLWCGP